MNSLHQISMEISKASIEDFSGINENLMCVRIDNDTNKSHEAKQLVALVILLIDSLK